MCLCVCVGGGGEGGMECNSFKTFFVFLLMLVLLENLTPTFPTNKGPFSGVSHFHMFLTIETIKLHLLLCYVIN